MYRTVILLCTFFGYMSTAPQSSLEHIEIIADVKPTTYDMPFSAYDVPPSLPIDEPAPINDVSLDSNLEDFPFDTTESVVDLAKYADVATDNYDSVTELPESDYGINMKDPKFYSKLGYFLTPHMMADGLHNNGDATTYTKKPLDNDEKEKDIVINETKHKSESPGDAFHSKGNEINNTVNTSVATTQTSIKNEAVNVENKTSSIGNNVSIVDNNPNRIENKRSNIDNAKSSIGIKLNSLEIDENSIEIKPQSGEFKSNKIGFQPKYTSMSRKGNGARQISKLTQRKYRTKCRCEKIWNCPRLQITVPRCPNEYFMCCF